MEAKTKKILVVGAVAVGSLILLSWATKKVIERINFKKGDVDNDKPDTPPFDPAKQFKMLYLGQAGYVNVRSTPLVPETMNYLDWLATPWEYLQDKTKSNLIGKVTTNPVGIVSKEEKGADGYLWYRVQLKNKIGDNQYGWVREDAVRVEIKNK